MSDKSVVLRLVVEGFGAAKNDLEFITTEANKYTEAKKQQNRESSNAARVINAEEGSIEKLRAQTALLRQEANNMKAVTAAEIKQRDLLSKKINDNTVKIRDFDRSISGSSTLVGEYEKGFGTAFKKIGVAIGAFVAAFAAAQGVIRGFKAIIESADVSGDMLERTLGGVKGGLDNLMKSVATGDWSSLLRNMAEAIRTGKEYAATLDLIADSGRALTMAEADLLVVQSELEQKVKDVNLTYEDREKAGQEFMLNAKSMSEKRQKIASDEYNALIEKVKGTSQLTQEQIESIVRQDEATMQAIATGQKYIELTDEFNTTRYFQAKREREALGERAKEYSKFVKDYNKLTEDEKDAVIALYEKKKAAEYAWFTENKRIYTMIGTLTKQVNKDEEKSLAITERKVAVIREAGISLSGGAVANPEVSAEMSTQLALTKLVDTGNKQRTSIMMEEAEARYSIVQGEADALMGLGNLVASLAGENKSLAIAAIVIQKAASIAQIISNIAIANVKAIAASPLTLGQPWVTINTIAGGIAAAGVIAESAGSISEINKYALGGRVQGGYRVRPDSRGDDTLAVLSQGEVVLNKRHQSFLGASALKKAGVPGFAEGGYVGNLQQSPGAGFTGEAMIGKLADSIKAIRVQLSLPELHEAERRLELINTSSPL